MTSPKILPYVYQCTNRETQEFYIGVRWANKVPALEDLGHIYKTSSKLVKPRFKLFDYKVIAEFPNKEAAFEYEQSLIRETYASKQSLNIAVQPVLFSTMNKRAAGILGSGALWKKTRDDPSFKDYITTKRKEQSASGNNPMQGKKQRRVSCLICRKEMAFNFFMGDHKKYCPLSVAKPPTK